MDLRTGKTYESVDQALADGVPASDIFLRRKLPTRRHAYEAPVNPKYPERHEGARERARRLQHEGAQR